MASQAAEEGGGGGKKGMPTWRPPPALGEGGLTELWERLYPLKVYNSLTRTKVRVSFLAWSSVCLFLFVSLSRGVTVLLAWYVLRFFPLRGAAVQQYFLRFPRKSRGG